MIVPKVPKVPKVLKIYECILCDYTTSRLSQYNRHKLSSKHNNYLNDSKNDSAFDWMTARIDCTLYGYRLKYGFTYLKRVLKMIGREILNDTRDHKILNVAIFLMLNTACAMLLALIFSAFILYI